MATEAALAADENVYLGQIQPQSEQAVGQGRSALWTLPDVATQYQPLQLPPAMQAALQAQREGRFIEALILLDDAGKSVTSTGAKAELNLLHASFLLQGKQSEQAIKILAPWLADARYAADAYALTAMACLQQGQMQQALDAAQHAQGQRKDQGKDQGKNQGKNMQGSILPPLALSYALQGMGRLAEARDAMHGFNNQPSNIGTPQQAVALAREAELDLTLDRVQSAVALVNWAEGAEATHPYVISVSGLVHLINGQAREAKAAFETALRRDPGDAKALFGLGLAEIKLGNFQAGQRKLQAANEADTGNALILTYLGRAQQQLGQTGAAMTSFDSAQQADPKDPIPWLYQAQAALQANRLPDARESLRQAQARSAYRQVYRGENLLREDEQLLQANLAEIQRRLGMDSLAFHTLTASVSEKNAANLRNQADVLQGQRSGESARRSLLLQSLFNDRPGNLPAALDIYGDMAGQTGASTPQHGVVSGLSAQQASYRNYDELFGGRATLEADAVVGSQNSNGEQIRLGVGNDTLGLGIAGHQFKGGGFAPFDNLDNTIAQAIVQWRPTHATQAFVSHQTFNSQHGETFYPVDPGGINASIVDNSKVTRLGLRHSLADGSELRGLWSLQKTDQMIDQYDLSVPPNYSFSTYASSSAHGEELQYRRSGAAYAAQLGAQQTRAQINYWYSFPYSFDYSQKAQQVYAAWQQTLNPQWQLEAGLGWGKIDKQFNIALAGQNNSLARWQPKLGAVWTPDVGTHVRLAAWQGMGVFAAGDATLAPVSLAGILLARHGDNGKLVKAISLGADRQLNPAWTLAAQTQRRKTGDPYIDDTGQQLLLEQQVDESRLALHWQPEGKPWGMSLAFDDERIQNPPLSVAQDSVDEQHLRAQQLALRWFASAQWAANLAWSHNQVTGTHKIADYSLPPPYFVFLPYQDSFNQLDADLSWQFNRSGSLAAGVRNATDTRFQYADIDRLNPRFSNGRLVYAKLKFAW